MTKRWKLKVWMHLIPKCLRSKRKQRCVLFSGDKSKLFQNLFQKNLLCACSTTITKCQFARNNVTVCITRVCQIFHLYCVAHSCPFVCFSTWTQVIQTRYSSLDYFVIHPVLSTGASDEPFDRCGWEYMFKQPVLTFINVFCVVTLSASFVLDVFLIRQLHKRTHSQVGFKVSRAQLAVTNACANVLSFTSFVASCLYSRRLGVLSSQKIEQIFSRVNLISILGLLEYTVSRKRYDVHIKHTSAVKKRLLSTDYQLGTCRVCFWEFDICEDGDCCVCIGSFAFIPWVRLGLCISLCATEVLWRTKDESVTPPWPQPLGGRTPSLKHNNVLDRKRPFPRTKFGDKRGGQVPRGCTTGVTHKREPRRPTRSACAQSHKALIPVSGRTHCQSKGAWFATALGQTSTLPVYHSGSTGWGHFAVV